MGDVANTITPIHYAASKNDIALITALLKQGYSINGLSAMHETPLIYSVQIKNIEPATIKFLLDHGADPNFRYGNQASTALIFAVTSNRPEIVEILLEHKADPLLANHWGNAVDYAKNMGHTKILAMLNK
jgi:ankyrin repeat protein